MDSRARNRLVCGVTLALVALLGASVVSPAVGGPKPLTLSKAKKVFVTKKKANKTFVTKKEAASFLTTTSADGRYLTPGGGDARYLPRTGETRIPVSHDSWRLVNNTPDILVTAQLTSTVLTKQSVPLNNIDLFAPVAVPTTVGGLGLKVVGLELCYSFPSTALTPPVIDRIAFQRAARSPSAPTPTTLTTVAVDDSGRVDDACATVRFAPYTLLPTDLVGVGLRVDFPDANTQVRLGAGSLILVS